MHPNTCAVGFGLGFTTGAEAGFYRPRLANVAPDFTDVPNASALIRAKRKKWIGIWADPFGFWVIGGVSASGV